MLCQYVNISDVFEKSLFHHKFMEGCTSMYIEYLEMVLCKGINFYLSPLILTALLHVDLINVAYLTACAFIRSS